MNRDRPKSHVVQHTLEAGDRVVERTECEYFKGCTKYATHNVETLRYDGGGWVYQDVKACPECLDEWLECHEEEKARELKPCERWEEA